MAYDLEFDVNMDGRALTRFYVNGVQKCSMNITGVARSYAGTPINLFYIGGSYNTWYSQIALYVFLVSSL